MTDDTEDMELGATPDERAEFRMAYVTCAWWDATGETSPDNLPDEHRTTLEREADEFLDTIENVLLIRRAHVRQPSYTFGSAGHDFWLTRHRHGAGFWDRGLGDVGDELTEMSHPWGDSDFPAYEFNPDYNPEG